MAEDCMSNAQRIQAGLNTNIDASYGDKGIALKNNPRYEGDSGQSKAEEGLAPLKTASAALVQQTGRQ